MEEIGKKQLKTFGVRKVIVKNADHLLLTVPIRKRKNYHLRQQVSINI